MGGPVRLVSLSAFLHSISRIPSPANTVNDLENAGRFGWRINVQGRETGPLGAEMNKRIRGWHGRDYLFTVAYIDGHAGIVKMKGHQDPAPHLPYYPPWPGDSRSRGYDWWNGAIIRGPGWQLDTFPSAPSIADITVYGGWWGSNTSGGRE